MSTTSTLLPVQLLENQNTYTRSQQGLEGQRVCNNVTKNITTVKVILVIKILNFLEVIYTPAELFRNENETKTIALRSVTTKTRTITNETRKLCYRKDDRAMRAIQVDREPLLRYGHSKLSKMAAAAILNLFESKIAPLDPPSPKTLP